jgi:hypothetical protein
MTEDSDFAEDEAVPGLDQYAVVAARRQQWDILLWQMPTMALTGEAFLLTISLARSTSQTGRIIASGLALVVAVAALHSLAAHRLSELTDAEWLRDHERLRGASQIHGVTWRERRAEMISAQRSSDNITDRLVARMYRFRSISVWFWTMALIACAAGLVLALSIFANGLLLS